MLNTILIIVVILILLFGINQVINWTQQISEKTQNIFTQAQELTSQAKAALGPFQINNNNDIIYEKLPETIIPRSNGTTENQIGGRQRGGDNGNNGTNSNNGTNGASSTTASDPLSTGTTVIGTVGEQLSDTRIGSGQPLGNLGLPVGAPVRAFVEFGEIAAAHPKDIWLDNVALTIPPSNVGTTDIVFVDAGRPQQCYQKCKASPFCRFFSYWKETGVCNLHQTLQNGETTPENMIRYAYTTPFSQNWVSGYVRKAGSLIPPNQL